METKDAPVITIDGPSGSGKGTVALAVARELGWHFLDSGALYRVLGLAAGERGLDLDDEAALAALARELDVGFGADAGGAPQVHLDGRVVDAALRTEAAGAAASRVAALAAVRDALLERQRAFRRAPGLVADGRDMGTVVFPDAPLKVFLTASADERARRRYNQLKEKGLDANLAALVEDIRQRDERDANRAVAPLRPARDAVVVDTSALDVAASVARVRALARERLGR